MTRIFLSPPHIGARELELLTDAVRSNWIAPLGPHVDAFEREFASRIDVPHALAVSSGTAALHLALVVAGIGPGDRVAVSTLTFAATAFAVRYVGAIPVFIDADTSWTMDAELLEDELVRSVAAGRPIRAVISVDLYGQPCDYARIGSACRRHGAVLIQDAAEALGASYRGRPIGGQGDLAVFSFNGNKIITTSGGGMLVSSCREWIDHARKLSTQAREAAPHYEHREIGFNYRLSNLLAAVGRAQLEVLEARVAARRAINARYREHLAHVPGVTLLDPSPHGEWNAWLTCLTIDATRFGADREKLRLALESENIEARPVWKPMHLQPVFADCEVRAGRVSQELFEHGLCLPSGSSLEPPDQDRVIDVIRSLGRTVRP